MSETTYLVLRGCGPVGNLVWVRDVFLEAVGAEGSEADSSSAEDGAGLPDQGAHCVLLGFCIGLIGGGEEGRGFVRSHSVDDHDV